MNVLVSAFSGSGNIGDESILEGLRQGFKQAEIDADLTVLTLDPDRAAAYHPDISFIKRPDPGPGIFSADLGEMIRAYKKADLVIIGGGGLIQDAHTPITPPRYLQSIILGKYFGAKTAIFGAGIGPLENSLSWEFLNKTIKYCDYIMVRDDYSLQYLEQIGVEKGVVVSDLAYCLSPDLGEGRGEERLVVGLSVREFNFTRKSFQEIAKACQRLIDKHNAEIKFIPFGEDGELTDREVGKIIQSYLDSDEFFTILPLANSAQAHLHHIKSCDIVMAGRLHAVILASLNNIPTIGLSYLPKVKREMKSLGYSEKYYISDTSSIESGILYTKCRGLMQQRGDIEGMLSKNICSKKSRLSNSFKDLLNCRNRKFDKVEIISDAAFLSCIYSAIIVINIYYICADYK